MEGVIEQNHNRKDDMSFASIDTASPYYPITEGELRSILDLEHIPHNANIEEVFKANTKVLGKILNRNQIQVSNDILERNHCDSCDHWDICEGCPYTDERTLQKVSADKTSDLYKKILNEMFEYLNRDDLTRFKQLPLSIRISFEEWMRRYNLIKNSE